MQALLCLLSCAAAVHAVWVRPALTLVPLTGLPVVLSLVQLSLCQHILPLLPLTVLTLEHLLPMTLLTLAVLPLTLLTLLPLTVLALEHRLLTLEHHLLPMTLLAMAAVLGSRVRRTPQRTLRTATLQTALRGTVRRIGRI